MASIVVQVAEICNMILDRIRTAIGFDLTQAQWLRMLLVVIVYTQIVRPWMVKGAEKEGEKQLAEMEQRDRDKREKAEREEAVNGLRTGKRTERTEDKSIASKILNGSEGVRERTVNAAEEGLLTAEEIRARKLENWEEDQEFLRHFSKTSDRAYAK